MTLFGINLEFFIFGATLLGVAMFHRHTLLVGLTGLCCLIGFKLLFVHDFPWREHFLGITPFIEQLLDREKRCGEWPILVNLLGLLLGFAVLSRHFEETKIPDILPKILPDDWKGPFMLLAIVFVMSSFLDNIAAVMIGGTIALVVFNKKVHIGYLAAIVAASNAGGSGSVIGDTTTTMMWISGVPATKVLHAYIAAVPAFIIFGVFSSFQQHAFQPIQKDPVPGIRIVWKKIGNVFLILALAIAANYFFDFPALGVWAGILIGAFISSTPWGEIKKSFAGSMFLLSLVTCASLMPVDKLPHASWHTSFVLGLISSIFDNIPLTKLALDQGGYDWGILAYAVGFGGSMIWFGSSTGVAISNKFPQAKSVVAWLKSGWHVALAYGAGFFVLLAILGWNPHFHAR